MKTKKILIVTFMAIVLCLSMVLVAFAACNTQIDQDQEQGNDIVENGGMSIEDNVIGNGIMLASTVIPRELYEEYGISPIAETAQTITATISPAGADNKKVDWTLAWNNPNSTWAKGKNVSDYVSVTPTTDGALTATIQGIKAFGEQVILTVTSRDNTAASATCTIDYRKRLEGVQLTINGVAYNNTNGMKLQWLGARTSNSLSNTNIITRLDSVGTVDYSLSSNMTIYIQYEQAYVEAMCKCSTIGTTSNSLFYTKRQSGGFYANDVVPSTVTDKNFNLTHFDFFAAFSYQMASNARNVPYQAWGNAAATIMKNYGTKKIATIFVNIPTAQYGTVTFEIPVSYDMTNVTTFVDGVTLSQSGITL